ncbi:hypothetical protein F0562_022871 [Nyssa sinensis]|uniref:non-specific serine/threonine protein kinase n=1 Tax=Nyssa sinensis TaxID=561372 RepID=A0A5J5BG45_9ASTE|nr:hypothetical protein F0562_022871 [Nyssa sinensis]
MKNLKRMKRFLKYLLFAFLCDFAFTIVVHAQVQSGFISLDCGIPEDSNYTDESTGLIYTSDVAYIDTGESKSISPELKSNSLVQQFLNVRSFPRGTRNCYTLRPVQGKGNKYLIRARFFYGNYDAKNKTPTFDLHIGVDFWQTVPALNDLSLAWRSEIIHNPTTDYIHVCLVKTGDGTPFISALELRPLNNSIYVTKSGSLSYVERWDLGSTAEKYIRYGNDVYDRIWKPLVYDNTTSLQTDLTIEPNRFQPPSIVMSTALTPIAAHDPLSFTWESNNSTDRYYFYMHFAELQANQTREFNIYLNGELWFDEPVVPRYLHTTTIYSRLPLNHQKYEFSLNQTNNSILPPIINAIEIYNVTQLLNSQTNDNDVDAIVSIKLMYGLTRNWQGDPCAPKAYVWEGFNCSYDAFNPPRIIFLNLSSSGLTGNISLAISNLTMIQSLDLSNNKLTGQVPDFLSGLAALQVLNLKGNNFTGPIPVELFERSKNGTLSLSIDDCGSAPCNKKKNNVVVPVVSSVAAFFAVSIAILAVLWTIKKRKQVVTKVVEETNRNDRSLEFKKRQFTYSEVLTITNNFQRVVGKGGFGTVYHGYVEDTNQVAVKMLSSSSIQGYKEFQAEANLLMSVHHKNLTSLVGYCIEGTDMGIIYEYMANGNLGRHLSAEDGTYVSTIIAGTPGYLDPQYYISNRFTEKSDVYSFGIVLLEIITSQPALPKGNDKTHIIQWVSSMVHQGDVKNIVDPRLRGDFDVNSVWKAVELAMACVSHTSTRRPTMNYVVMELKECLTTEKTRHEMESTDSIEMTHMSLESDLLPLAR